MLGGQRDQALRLMRYQGVPYTQLYPVHPDPPNWKLATYVYKGTSNGTSYDYTRPQAYRRKDERRFGQNRPA